LLAAAQAAPLAACSCIAGPAHAPIHKCGGPRVAQPAVSLISQRRVVSQHSGLTSHQAGSLSLIQRSIQQSLSCLSLLAAHGPPQHLTMGKWDKGGSSGTQGGGWAATLEAQLQAMEPRELLLTVALGVLSLGVLGWLFGMCGGGKKEEDPEFVTLDDEPAPAFVKKKKKKKPAKKVSTAPSRGMWVGAWVWPQAE
jgi:hypothetical protein